MTDSEKMLRELRAKLAEDRKLLETREQALTVLEQMIAQPSLSQLAMPFATADVGLWRLHAPAVTSIIPNGEFRSDMVTPKLTQKEAVKVAIQQTGEREFTVATIDGILTQIGMPFEGANPRNRISVVLGNLEEDGVIRKVFTGGGSVPHRYQSTAFDTAK